mgnify:CR=1 FL=1
MNSRYTSIKGRKLQNLVRNKILKTFPHLKENDVEVASTGQNGPDVRLSRIAKRLIPYQFGRCNETKFQRSSCCNLIRTFF